MVIAFHEKKDKNSYFYKQYQPKYGSAIYLPNKNYSGEGFMDVINWGVNNAAGLKDIASAATNTVSGIANTTLNTIRGIQEIKRLKQEKESKPPITETAQDRILAAIPEYKLRIGNGFKIIN